MKISLISIFIIIVPIVVHAAENQQLGFQEYQRDPFTTSDKMYSLVGLKPGERGDLYGGFIPGYGAPQQGGSPKMRLKGYVTKNTSKATALLEIEGAGVFMVREGDEIGLHAIGSRGVLKVIEVSKNGVKVQSGRLNQVILVK